MVRGRLVREYPFGGYAVQGRTGGDQDLHAQTRGESGIRTHGAASGSTVFETARFDRSRISPDRAQEDSNLRPLDPQSNALSRLSYGHMRVYAAPLVRPCTRRGSPSLATGSLSGLPAVARPRHPCLRRGGDSNPRYPFGVQRLSRAPDSATLAPLQIQRPSGEAPSASSPYHTCCSRHQAAREKRAEREGFEPPEPRSGSTVFKTASFDHSDTSPEQQKTRPPRRRDAAAAAHCPLFWHRSL